MTKCYAACISTTTCYDKRSIYTGSLFFMNNNMVEGIVMDNNKNEMCLVFGETNGDDVDLVICYPNDREKPHVLCLQKDENDYSGRNYGINRTNYSIDGDGTLQLFDPLDYYNVDDDFKADLGETIEDFKRFYLGEISTNYYNDMRTVVPGRHN